jgi:hypothetical protein
MRYQFSSVSSETLRARRIAPPLITMTLLAVSVLLTPGKACGVMFQSVGPTPFGDDVHSAMLDPYPAIAVSSIPASPPTPAGQCVWINTGTDQFKKDNPADGSGPTHEGWTFNWAGVDAEAKVEGGIKILDYFPYVVTPPAVTLANGTVYPKGDPGELGGAVINLSYTPGLNGAPVINNLHWIQALTGIRRGVAVPQILDTGPAFESQSTTTPFYDTAGGAAGTFGTNQGYFFDRPLINENEYEGNPVASVQFQVVLASDSTATDAKGVVQHTVTLYGGEWWGFTYTASDVPEPSMFVLLAFGGSGLFVFRKMTSRKRAA